MHKKPTGRPLLARRRVLDHPALQLGRAHLRRQPYYAARVYQLSKHEDEGDGTRSHLRQLDERKEKRQDETGRLTTSSAFWSAVRRTPGDPSNQVHACRKVDPAMNRSLPMSEDGSYALEPIKAPGSASRSGLASSRRLSQRGTAQRLQAGLEQGTRHHAAARGLDPSSRRYWAGRTATRLPKMESVYEPGIRRTCR